MHIWSIVIADLLASDSSTRFRCVLQTTGSTGLAVSNLVSHNGYLLFSGRDPDLGQELWYSDGTAAGTLVLKDIYPGVGASQPSHLTPFSKDNRVYFSAEGPELSWMIKEDYQDACQSFRQSSVNSNVIFAVAEQNVWDLDETYDCPVGFRWVSTSEAHNMFVSTSPLEEYSDEAFTYFDQCGWSGYEWGGRTRKFFRFSDSKTTGAFKHAGFQDSYRLDRGFQTDLFAGIVCFRESPTYQAAWGTQLWATDGTAAGTKRVARISPEPEGSNPSHFVELNQHLYFQASSTAFGSELWMTDGTRDGTVLVADIEFGSSSSEPRFLTAFDSRVFFSARTQAYGRELWFSDGESRFEYTDNQHTTLGTGLLLDICVGAKSSSPRNFAVINPSLGSPLLLFQADDCVHGAELWATDGTRAGTVLVSDIRPGAAGSHPGFLTSFANKVFFQANDGVYGAELWVTDGSSSGTSMLIDLAPGATGSQPSYLTILNSVNILSARMVFAAQAGPDQQMEFWQSDGSQSGTTKIFPSSDEIVELNAASLDIQLAAHALVSIPSKTASFFYLGRETGLEIRIDDTTPSISDALPIEQQWGDLSKSLKCSKGWSNLGRECSCGSLILGSDAGILEQSIDSLGCPDNYVGRAALISQNAQPSSDNVARSCLPEVCAVNEAPSITMNLTYYISRRQWVSLEEIEINDPDSAEGILYVSIAVLAGQLRVMLPPPVFARGPTALNPVVDGDSASTLEFATTVTQSKEIFGTLAYVCDDRYGCTDSHDHITVQVDDNGFTGVGGPQVVTKSVEIVLLDGIAA